MMQALKRSMRAPRIAPRPRLRTVPVSVRLPHDLYAQLCQYAEKLSSDRSYVIIECLRRALATDPGAPRPELTHSTGRKRHERKS
jgi:hypothetical protein